MGANPVTNCIKGSEQSCSSAVLVVFIYFYLPLHIMSISACCGIG